MNSLARISDTSSETATDNEADLYLTFVVKQESFAIDILNIKEIMEYDKITSLPMAPGFIRGVTDFRGAAVPVVDLAVRFGRSSTDIGKRSCIVIVELSLDGERRVFGLLVDAVSEVTEIPMYDSAETHSFSAEIRNDFIKGMGKLHDRLIIMLSVEQLLSMHEQSLLAMNKTPADLTA